MLKPILLSLLAGALALTSCKAKHTDHLASIEPPHSPAMRAYCRSVIASLPKDFFHGYVTVPEDYAKPNGRKIMVFYYGRKSDGGQVPVVFFNGGPAASSLNSYSLILQTQLRRTDWSKLPFVFIDQRGTGCSQEFPELINFGDGRRLALYSSKQVVGDAEVIRNRLGVGKWKIFGQSHGAQIVHRYIVDAPAGVYSAHAHGNSIGVGDQDMLRMRLQSQNRVLKEYLKRFPNDKDDLEALGNHFTPTTCYTDAKSKRKYCGKAIIHYLVYMLGFADRWLTLHEWIDDMSKDGEINTSTIQDFVQNVVADYTQSTSAENTASTYISKFDYGGNGIDYWICTRVMEQIKAAGEAPETWPLHECSASIAEPPTAEEISDHNTAKANLDDVASGEIGLEEFKAALIKNPLIPFYLYSGELDVFVPKESFENEIKALGNLIKYTHFSGSGHDGFYTEPLVWRNLLKGGPEPGAKNGPSSE